MPKSRAAVARKLHTLRKNIRVLLVEMTPNLPKQVKAPERIRILVSQGTLVSDFGEGLSKFLTCRVIWNFPGEVRDLCTEGACYLDLLTATSLCLLNKKSA